MGKKSEKKFFYKSKASMRNQKVMLFLSNDNGNDNDRVVIVTFILKN